MGIFDAIKRTRQFGADVIAVTRLTKEIYHELDSLVIAIDRANGVVSQYEAAKFKSIGRKFNELTTHSENMGTKFSGISVQFGPQKMLLPGAIMMILRITTDIEQSTGYSFGINFGS
ncbi:MAG: hypothetical protein Q8M08_02695 [Bacteroidales bacterium]|nr:hypothetical protein [Bacteroidales bacterium]